MDHETTLNPLAEVFIPMRGGEITFIGRKEPVVVHSRSQGTLNPLADEFRPGQQRSVYVGGQGQKYTLNPQAKIFVPRYTLEVYNKLTRDTGVTNYKESDGVAALTNQTNERIENDVANPDRVDREVTNDTIDGCYVPPNEGDINVYVNELSDHESPDGGGQVIGWTDNVTICDFTVVKNVKNDAMTLEYKNFEGGTGLCNCSHANEGGVFKKGNMNHEVNVYDVKDVIKQIDVTSHYFPKCSYSPVIVNESVGFQQAKNPEAQTPPQEHFNRLGAVHDVEDYMELARTVRASHTKNCDGVRQPVASNLNLHRWAHYLDKYDDTRLLQFMTYGFPLGDMKADVCRSQVRNHTSATEYADHVHEFLITEESMGAIMGPFTKIPAHCCHISPLMSRAKDNNKRRIILDLSYGDQESVNGNTERGTYDGLPYTLTLPSLDYLIHDILKCTGKPKLMKIDISRAFRNVPIDPGDALKLGMNFEGKFYVDRSLAFGAVNGTAIFQRISDAIRKILSKEHITVWNYIDDIFACVSAQRAQEVFQRVEQLILELGLPINDTKVVRPADSMTCVGIEVDAQKKTVRIPQGKMEEILTECKNFKTKKVVSRKNLQSLLGKLLYVAKIVVPARAFLNRMLWYLRSTKSELIRLGDTFHRDLLWFTRFLTLFNESPSFKMIGDRDDIHVWVDASLVGIGAVWGARAYAEKIPEDIRKGRSIVHFEMYNIIVMIKHWAKRWQGAIVYVHSDNMAVVHTINSLRANDEFLGVCIRNLLMEAAQYNIHIKACHVQGIHNTVADALSRLGMGSHEHEWVLGQVSVERVRNHSFKLDFYL